MVGRASPLWQWVDEEITKSDEQDLLHMGMGRWDEPEESGESHYLKCGVSVRANFCTCYHFYFDYILFIYKGHANFDFKQCSIFTEFVFNFEKGSDG